MCPTPPLDNIESKGH